MDFTTIIVTVIFIILGIGCVVTNCSACYVAKKSRKLKIGNVKYYIMSLAMTDILIGLISIPTYLVAINTGTVLSSYVTGYVDPFLAACSIIHLCMMAFDRTIAVMKPILYRTRMRSKRTAFKMVSVSWLLTVILMPVVFFAPNIEGVRIAAMIIIFIPCLFVIVCQVLIFTTIHKRNVRIPEISSAHRINETKIAKIILVASLAFIILWLPFCIVSSFLNFFNLSPSQFSYLLGIVKFLHYSNSICNPIIYAVFNANFRSEFKQIYNKFHCFCKQRIDIGQISQLQYGETTHL